MSKLPATSSTIERVDSLIYENRLSEARTTAHAAYTASPDDPMALVACGRIAVCDMQLVEAINFARRAQQRQPGALVPLLLEVEVRRRAGDFAAASELLRQISQQAQLSPANEARCTREAGLIALESGDFAAALKLLQRASRARPTDVQLTCELGHVQDKLGAVDASHASFLRAHKLNPRHYLAAKNLVSSYLNVGLIEEAVALADTLVDRAGLDHDFFSLWLLASTSSAHVDAADLDARHRRYALLADAAVTPMPPRAQPASHEVMRIGYFSHHFYHFPLASFLPQVLGAHDRSRVRVYLFAVGGVVDDITRRYVELADEYHDLSTMSDAEAAARIRELGIDVLVDLSGYVAANRFNIMRYRPACVQMSWLGYLGSLQSDRIDCHITDETAWPPSARARFIEQLAFLPVTQFPYAPVNDVIERLPAELPRDRNGHITFGCFAANTKLGTDCVQAMLQILAAVPDSKLLLYAVSQTFQIRIRSEIGRIGLKGSRIQFFARLDRQRYLEMIRNVDIVLDAFPFCGGTTVCDALWMGVPTIALQSPRTFGGGAASALAAAGLNDLVTSSVEAYVDTAIELSAVPVRMRVLRQRLRDDVRRSALLDIPRTVRALEGIYQRALESR